jgi:hypothetical protein
VTIEEPVTKLLSDLERALANEVEFYNGDISDLELTLKGVESLSVDWVFALCKLVFKCWALLIRNHQGQCSKTLFVRNLQIFVLS